MDKEALRRAFGEAVEAAKHSPQGMLPRLMSAYAIELNGKGYAPRCPWCQKKDTFNINNKKGVWLFGCFYDKCEAHKGGDEVGFIALKEGLTRRDAAKRLLEIAGIENPFDGERGKKTEDNKTQDTREEADEADRSENGNDGGEPDWEELRGGRGGEEAVAAGKSGEGDGLRYLKIPESGRNAYEAFWAEMRLSQAHRQELKWKRGQNDRWIDALGFVTATRGNLARLTQLIEKFPEKELLKNGLVQRNNYTRKLEVAGMLWGHVWDKVAKEYRDEDIIIIPYLDRAGRITGLRPHKRGLSTSDHRKEEVAEFYNKTNENLRTIYGEQFLLDRPKEFEHSCLICEGEFKAVAPAMCGIPAIGFQGIEYFLQNKASQQAIQTTVDLLKRNKIREVIVVFDSEAKLDKPFSERFNAEIWARFTALVLEDHGFKALFAVLPDEWRVDGKADWDGRLAWHVRNSKSHAAGLKAAQAEFHKFLRHRTGERPSVRKPPRQMDWMCDLKEDVIMQALNKLRHVPKIFTGGAYELDLATEFTNWCHPDYKDKLAISKLTAALRETYGGYYKPKPPSEALEKRALDALKEVEEVLKKHDEEMNLSEEQLRQYRAVKSAALTTLYRYPKAFTDFTAESKYKVLCHEPDGSTRLDRLIVFKDKNGRRSKPIQMAGDKLNSSQELRKFFPKVGSYHWWGNQEECDYWLQELDVQNYQRTITEIDTYGWNREVGLYIMGDCAVGSNGKFIFPDKHGIIWHKDLGYKNSEGVESGTAFCHKPPMLFPNMADARKAHDEIDWLTEQREVGKIWRTLQKDFVDAFGGIAGYAAIGAMLQYMAHPALMRSISGKPGFWVQGRKGSGKTKTVEAGMRIFGFPRNYEIVALGSTKVGIERNLSQFCGLPVHIDEWRNRRADDNTVGFITNAFNEIGISKGTMVGTKSTRKSRASTIPIVTGEDGATDPALRSRYLRLVMSSAQRQGTPQEQRQRYFQMLENADSYHRVGRFLFRHRDAFAARIVQMTRDFIAAPETGKRIPGDREQEVAGICLSAVLAAQEFIDPEGMELMETPQIKEFMLKHMAESCSDTTNDIFMVNFFADAVNMINRGVPHVDKYLRICRGMVDDVTGRINIIPDVTAMNGRVIVLIAYRELYDEFMADKGKLREVASIARSNIQAELKAEDAWVQMTARPGVHRYRLPWKNGARDILRTYWALDYEKCPPELRDVFRSIYERELEEVDYALNDKDEVVHQSELNRAEEA
ncbi:MAG: DUF927 domain-containing protein [Verrucomicrobiota bacterium]